MSNWSEAYKRYSPEIRAFLQKRMWRRPDEAEDLCQETFARALGAATELRDPAKVRAYLMRIANNLLISRIRRPNLVSNESDLGEDSVLTAREDPRASDPMSETEKSELREKVAQLLTELPEDQRTAFELGVIERRPYAEIAEVQNWTVSKVKISIFRARKRLMEDLREYR